jgi:glycerol-3-phosphate dehydrogenase
MFTANDAQAFLQEINAAYPTAQLSMNDVRYWYGGLTPAEDDSGQHSVRRVRQSEIVDHATRDNLEGFISVNGVKYTTARLSAEKAVNLVFNKIGVKPPPCLSSTTPLPGASNGPVNIDQQTESMPDPLQLYGCNADLIRERMEPGSSVDSEAIFKAACRYAIDHEMAVRLQDVILRRTNHARLGNLTENMFTWCADTLSQQLKWSDKQKQQELNDAHEELQRHGVRLQHSTVAS